MEKGANPFLGPEWLDVQRRYLEILLGSAENPQPPGHEEWRRALEHWRASVMPLIPDASRELFDSILDRSLTSFSLYNQFAQMLKDIAGAGDDGEWQSILSRHIAGMKQQFDNLADLDSNEANNAMDWLLPLESWKQASRFLYPDKMPGGMQEEELRKISEQFLAIPGFGPFREQYEMFRENSRLWLSYQEKCREYRNIFFHLGKTALDRLETKILQRGEENTTINSLRELYNLWVESNEEVFSDYAASEEYSVLYGELVAAYMEFRHQNRTLGESLLRQFDLVTGSGAADTGRDQRELRELMQENREEQRRLQSTIEDLKRQIEELKTGKDKTREDRNSREADDGGQDSG